MKAMILAAGLGTRLAPYTDHTPKPLFSINQRPVLDMAIDRLLEAGCSSIIVNTHHLHARITDHVASASYGPKVFLRHEPRILGTGGGIANIADLWGPQGPLLVINGDIVCDIDLSQVIEFHRDCQCPVTMVMHHHPSFNTVQVTEDDFVAAFDEVKALEPHIRKMAFTGIHVLEPEVLSFLPPQGFANIIDAYRQMLENHRPIKAMIARNHYWNDIGTPERYRSAALDHMTPLAFKAAFGQRCAAPPAIYPLHGDGSDRRWFRLVCGPYNVILADHGIRKTLSIQEVDAYVAIGRHLHQLGLPVPRIYLADTFCGLVFVEDVGDTHLQAAVANEPEKGKFEVYCHVIDQWLAMAIKGQKGFDPAWTHQSSRYDRELILEKEARYFTEAYLKNFLGWEISFDDLAEDFRQLADETLANAVEGFMHRDFQSRNIMLNKGKIYFIDFQGGRLGPLQYDLASLLIDPYTALPAGLQDELLHYAVAAAQQRFGIDKRRFLNGYGFCALSRNLQILGAFAFLSRVKGKTVFASYIPQAVKSLRENLEKISTLALPRLKAVMDQLSPQGKTTVC
jgi:aminoglycoside/choline kinase family phosphotransferase/dTDP-glucose pyrophosphorylase